MVNRVWATVLRPDFDPGSPDDPVTYLPEFEQDHMGDSRYEGNYSNFKMNGRYILTIYAKDADELLSEPMQVRVLENVVYSDVNGDLDVNLTDLIIAMQVLSGFDPPGARRELCCIRC